MRYTAMIVGFLFATLTAVGAAEPDRPDNMEFKLDGLVTTRTLCGAVIDWASADQIQSYTDSAG